MEFDKEQKEFFDKAVKTAGQLLIATMTTLDIPNFIDAGFTCDGFQYKLSFTKKPLQDESIE